jgi:PKD repeat protein
MNRTPAYRLVSVLVVILLVATCTASPAVAAVDETRETSGKLYRVTRGDRGTQEYIVKFQSAQAMKRFLSGKDLKPTLKREWKRLDMILLALTPTEAAELSRDRDILFVEENGFVHLLDQPKSLNMADMERTGKYNDPSVLIQYRGVEPTEEYQYGIRKMGGEDYHQKGYLGQGVRIGVIDTGIDPNHPDLHVAGGYSFFRKSPDYSDIVFHGTHVAGIIAAKRNGFGVVGMAPEAEVYSLAVFNEIGQASIGNLIDAIQWCIDHDIDIINMSFGSDFPSAAMKEALQKASDAGILLVAAAGNSGRGDYDNVLYPAKYDTVIAVAAIDENDQVADWSSRGPEVELAAPGVAVLSTFSRPNYYEHTYQYLSGTSMATPHIVGLAALIMSANPGISSAELRRRLATFTQDLGPAGRDIEYGFGLPTPDRAGDAPDTDAPRVSAGGPYRGVLNEPVQFTTDGTLDPDDNFLVFTWDFGDGSSAAGGRAMHAYTKPGDYTATLTARDGDGREGSSTAPVLIRAGILRTVHTGASAMGSTAASGTASLKSTLITAGIQSGKRSLGLVRFTFPKSEDIFVVNADLSLTGNTRRPTAPEGVISAGLLPGDIAARWPSFTFADIDQAEVVSLEPPITLSYLGGQVGQGIVNRFSVPYNQMAPFEDQFAQGSEAFRIRFDSGKTGNSYTWKAPELSVRYLSGVSSANMAPVAHAGYDRRAKTGTRVILDGSASSDPEGFPLTFTWVQVRGKQVDLAPVPDHPARAGFTAPSGNDVLVFEVRVSDADHTATDQVTIYLNDAKAEVNTILLLPACGKAGFVTDEFPGLNFFDRRMIIAGPLPRERQEGEETAYGEAANCGAFQFDLSTIPPGSQVLSATLELTGAMDSPGPNRGYDVRVVSSDVDARWMDLDWNSLTTAPVVVTLKPHLANRDVGLGRVNRFRIDPGVLESRRGNTGIITFRIDGPLLRHQWYESFSWWSGNEPEYREKGPRLVITYSARDALPGSTLG